MLALIQYNYCRTFVEAVYQPEVEQQQSLPSQQIPQLNHEAHNDHETICKSHVANGDCLYKYSHTGFASQYLV